MLKLGLIVFIWITCRKSCKICLMHHIHSLYHFDLRVFRICEMKSFIFFFVLHFNIRHTDKKRDCEQRVVRTYVGCICIFNIAQKHNIAGIEVLLFAVKQNVKCKVARCRIHFAYYRELYEMSFYVTDDPGPKGEVWRGAHRR